MKSIFNKQVQDVTNHSAPARTQLSLFARRTAADLRAAAVARAAVLEVLG